MEGEEDDWHALGDEYNTKVPISTEDVQVAAGQISFVLGVRCNGAYGSQMQRVKNPLIPL